MKKMNYISKKTALGLIMAISGTLANASEASIMLDRFFLLTKKDPTTGEQICADLATLITIPDFPAMAEELGKYYFSRRQDNLEKIKKCEGDLTYLENTKMVELPWTYEKLECFFSWGQIKDDNKRLDIISEAQSKVNRYELGKKIGTAIGVAVIAVFCKAVYELYKKIKNTNTSGKKSEETSPDTPKEETTTPEAAPQEQALRQPEPTADKRNDEQELAQVDAPRDPATTAAPQ